MIKIRLTGRQHVNATCHRIKSIFDAPELDTAIIKPGHSHKRENARRRRQMERDAR